MIKSNQNRTPLFDALKKFINDDVVRFHVPGHKQGRGIPELKEYIGDNVLKMDVNGMADLDYLNNPTGVISEAQKLFADAYNAQHAFFLVNGTTSGVQAMIMSTCEPGDKIILPRNAHKSAINSLILSSAIPVYIQPEINDHLGIAAGITIDKLKKAINENPDAKAVFIINPNYYGIASDIKSIIRIAHMNGMAVLVDEAHGAHLPFHDSLPLSAMEAGADMSSISMHKTGGSLTQSSVLLLRGSMISPDYVKQVINLTCTSSASYLLMCSLDVARKQLALSGYEILDRTLNISRWAREELNKIKGLYAFGNELIGTPGCFDFDETKLAINVKELGFTGWESEAMLREQYNIQIELSDIYNILAIVSMGDRLDDVKKLADALKDMAQKTKNREIKKAIALPNQPEMVVTPRDAFFSHKKTVPLDESAGEISGEMVMAYPPGIPVICMGELITGDIIDYIRILKEEKCEIQGTESPHADFIKVLKK